MTARQSLTSRVLVTSADMTAIAEEWRALEVDCADPLAYFQSYDWCYNWVSRFCQNGQYQPYVVTLWRGERLVAVWPRMIVRSAYLRRLETLGVPHSQYCGVLVRIDETKTEDVAAALRAAARNSGCDITISRAVPEGTALSRLLVDKPVIQGSANYASMLDLSGYSSAEDYANRLGKLQKRNRNRRRNHLARLGALDFEVIWPGHEDFDALVRQCAVMKREWLAATGRFSFGFSMDGYETFLASLDGDANALSGACLSVLRAGERVVAIELGFLRDGHYYAYIGGFDWDLRDLSPGKVQMDMTVSWLIDQGISRYDLLVNPADYKKSWSNETIMVSSRAEALTWKGHFYASAWLPKVRPALKRLHGALPALMDRFVNLLRPAACLLLLYV